VGDVAPVPDRAAGGSVVVCKETERDHQANEENEIHGPVDEASHEWKHEEQSEDDADGGDDFGVDESLLTPCRDALVLVEIITSEACYDGCECQLADAKAQGEDIFEDHVVDCWMVGRAALNCLAVCLYVLRRSVGCLVLSRWKEKRSR